MLNRGKTLGTARKGELKPEELQDMMAGGAELADALGVAYEADYAALLAARPDAPVLVCEGEKAADAARPLFPDYVCLSWPGGANAVDKAGWQALAARDVTLWPDLDEPGAACMDKLAAILGTLNPPPKSLYRARPEVFGLTGKGDRKSVV